VTRALTSRGVQVLGQDTSEVIRRVAKDLHERMEAARMAQREAEAKYSYDSTDVVLCMVRRVSVNRESAVPFFVGSTATMVGGRIVSTQPCDDRHIDANMRMELAKAWFKSGECKTFVDARERAKKAKIILERSHAHLSAANGGVR
jgi:hypothetical protein